MTQIDAANSRPRRILSIGECMVELSQGPGGLLRLGFAGDTFNTAWYLRRELDAGFEVAYLSAVGLDKTSDDMLAFMAAGGVDTALVRRLPGRMPGLYLIHLDGAERSFSYWRDTSAAKALADDADHLDAAFSSADAFYVSGITLAILAGPARERLLTRLGAAKRAGKLVAFDPNIRPRLWPDAEEMRSAIEAGASVSTICLPSYPDEKTAFGDASPQASAARYLALGAAEVVVKDGPAPAILGEAGVAGFTELPAAPAVQAVDTTGAGDSFSAAYVAARLRGLSPTDSVRCGHALAGEVVRHHGALIRGTAET
ncbi:2-dehydro-3-deoxygluconokinase [Aureimonas sp. Leaf454]|uniref:sugar kinase n=1 Tax=Aureimonas sp. Leaf454 TaxID=1736381 RepID=UPI0006F35974|nr:sugar kinase [Aureimonas sp. Leaf454]KQT54763.1 2-dehydro-3-deoxygluconokinase [Aureimonas sp. Leaf454]